MINIFLEEHHQILFALLKNKVNFMPIGGYAVIHYGYDRNSGGMDIWLQTGNENRDRLIHALRDLGITNEDLEKLRRMDFTNPVPVFFFRESPRQIDFVTKINNISFEEAIKEARYFTLENRSIHVINYNHLIITNLSTNRAKDKADIEEPERINKYRKNN